MIAVMHAAPHAIVVIGVAGSGKTTVARGVARHFGMGFLDADDFHSDESKAQMAAGTPLTDAQRDPWVHVLQRELRERAGQGHSTVLAFSGLRAAHRQALRESGVPMRFVFLHASPLVIAERLSGRTGHFMPMALLASQLEALQVPAGEADVAVVDVECGPADVLARVIRALETMPGA